MNDFFQRIIIIVRGQLPPNNELEEDLQKYLSLNTYLDSEDPWFWKKLRYALPHKEGKSKRIGIRRDPEPIEGPIATTLFN